MADLSSLPQKRKIEGISREEGEEWFVVLFYKYTPIEDCKEMVDSMRELTEALGLEGRMLVASEGLNGTLGGPEEKVKEFVKTMNSDPRFGEVDWKYSTSRVKPFPDMNIRIVNEIVGYGNISSDPSQVTGTHLSPEEFHDALAAVDSDATGQEKPTVVLDIRNEIEHKIGHFPAAQSPHMRITSEFKGWADANVDALKDKKVLMYCTGGVRCEKASAYLRECGLDDVNQLSGGIHRYLEAFPDGGRFKGKNFVFDARVTMKGTAPNPAEIVGRCELCDTPWEAVSGGNLCSVCKAVCLVCDKCRDANRELHCMNHRHLSESYFWFLDVFTPEELEVQLNTLQSLLDGEDAHANGSRNKRRTLRKQIEKIQARRKEVCEGAEVRSKELKRCRMCGENEGCSGACWGFWSAPHSAAIS